MYPVLQVQLTAPLVLIYTASALQLRSAAAHSLMNKVEYGKESL